MPSPGAVEHGRAHWLGPWIKSRLDQQPTQSGQPLPATLLAKLNSDFANSFARLAALRETFSAVHTALATHRIPHLTLGAMPYAHLLYPHPAAKYSQDIDLLICPEDGLRAERALEAAGFARLRGHPVWRIDLSGHTLELDLHTTPGEEKRNPAVSLAYGQTTEHLFASAIPWPAESDWHAPSGALCLSLTVLADNRVIHFFKHYCHPLRHGLELAALLRLPLDMQNLRQQVESSRSGKVWAIVLEVLRAWGVDGHGAPPVADPTTPSDREFAATPRSRRLIATAAANLGEPVTPKLEYAMLEGTQRLRYAIGVVWPPRHILAGMYGRDPADLLGLRGAALLSRLRCQRIGKALKAAIGVH
jgi:hypothetical protein